MFVVPSRQVTSSSPSMSTAIPTDSPSRRSTDNTFFVYNDGEVSSDIWIVVDSYGRISPVTTISEFTQIVYPNGILNNGSYGVENSYGKFALRTRATATLMRGTCILPVSSTTLTMVTVSRIPTETVFLLSGHEILQRRLASRSFRCCRRYLRHLCLLQFLRHLVRIDFQILPKNIGG